MSSITTKVRLYISYPLGASVYNGIAKNHCSLSYITVDHNSEIIESLDLATQMAKVDIESAYRLIPVHLEDRSLLTVQLKGETFSDMMLSFESIMSQPKAIQCCGRWAGTDHLLERSCPCISLPG